MSRYYKLRQRWERGEKVPGALSRERERETVFLPSAGNKKKTLTKRFSREGFIIDTIIIILD